MGCSTEVVCVTCRKRYYCGYGSYGHYHEREKLFDALRPEHEGHNLSSRCGDGDDVDYKTGDLYDIGAYGSRGELVAEGYERYEVIDLTERERSNHE